MRNGHYTAIEFSFEICNGPHCCYDLLVEVLYVLDGPLCLHGNLWQIDDGNLWQTDNGPL